jgi:hypothetical protein
MGRKRNQEEESKIPIWVPKRPKMGRDDPMTPLNALMQYSSKFKLGQIKYQILHEPSKTDNKWIMRTVVGEDEMGFGEGPTKDAAMEKGALVTLHLFDPTGKSVCGNIVHHDVIELNKLQNLIENVKPEEISRAKGEVAAAATDTAVAPPPTLIPLHPPQTPYGAYGMPPPGYPPMMPSAPYGYPMMSPYGGHPHHQPPPYGHPHHHQPLPPHMMMMQQQQQSFPPMMPPPPYGYQPQSLSQPPGWMGGPPPLTGLAPTPLPPRGPVPPRTQLPVPSPSSINNSITAAAAAAAPANTTPITTAPAALVASPPTLPSPSLSSASHSVKKTQDGLLPGDNLIFSGGGDGFEDLSMEELRAMKHSPQKATH